MGTMGKRFYGTPDGKFYLVDMDEYVDYESDMFMDDLKMHDIVLDGDDGWWYHDFSPITEKLGEMYESFDDKLKQELKDYTEENLDDGWFSELNSLPYAAMEHVFELLNKTKDVTAVVVSGYSQGEAAFVLGWTKDFESLLGNQPVEETIQHMLFDPMQEVIEIDDNGFETGSAMVISAFYNKQDLDAYMKETFDATPATMNIHLTLDRG